MYVTKRPDFPLKTLFIPQIDVLLLLITPECMQLTTLASNYFSIHLGRCRFFFHFFSSDKLWPWQERITKSAVVYADTDCTPLGRRPACDGRGHYCFAIIFGRSNRGMRLRSGGNRSVASGTLPVPSNHLSVSPPARGEHAESRNK